MTTKLSEVGQDLYDQITARTLYVVDTEFCTHEGEHHLISLAIVPVIGGRRAKVNQEFYAVMNPGVPIDDITSAIHGFTDADVARRRPFNYYARVILARLTEADAVFVCHNTIDAHVLRRELERLDERAASGEQGITAGVADLPDMPVLDTQKIARATGYPGAPRSAKVSLDRLCDLTGVDRTKNAHDARADARATANALIEVLRHTAEKAVFWTFDELLADCSGGTTIEPKGPAHLKPRDFVQPPPPPEHVARHIYPLSDPVKANSDEAESWLTMAAECAALRCPYLRDEASVAAEANGAVLLRPLMDDLPHLTEPGQAGTLLGAVYELLLAGKTTLRVKDALMWWRHAKPVVQASPPCTRDAKNGLCPSCQEGSSCPRDVLYIPIAEIALLGDRGVLDSKRVRFLLDPSARKPVNTWRTGHPDVLAYTLWRIAERDFDEDDEGIAEKAVELGVALNLHTVEPRFTVLGCQRLIDEGDPDKAFKVAESVLAQRTTDLAYRELSDWVQFTKNAMYAQQPPPRKPLRYARKGRPGGHANPRLYS